LMPRSSAARVKLEVSATATKVRSRTGSNIGPPCMAFENRMGVIARIARPNVMTHLALNRVIPASARPPVGRSARDHRADPDLRATPHLPAELRRARGLQLPAVPRRADPRQHGRLDGTR